MCNKLGHVHVHINGSSIVDIFLHMFTYICIWIIPIHRHNNICLFSCIFVCISNRVISTGTFVHLVHIHVHLRDSIGVDICIRFNFAYPYVHMQIHMFTCKPTYVHFKCPYMFTSTICNELTSWIIFKFTELLTFVYTNTGYRMLDDEHWIQYARCQNYDWYLNVQ